MNNPRKTVRLAGNDLEFIFCEIRARWMKHKIIRFLEGSSNREHHEIANYLRRNPISVFPYQYCKNYNLKDIRVERDPDTDLLVVQEEYKRIYLRKKYRSLFRAKRYYNGILIEQDKCSPHRYISEKFYPPQDCIILDIGGAEGYFGLQYIDIAKKVYIFECDSEWEQALQYTYRNYGDKVQIIHKYVSDHSDDKNICLDDFIREHDLMDEKLFIKIDAEGAEPLIIDGMREILDNHADIWLALCTYHATEHEKIFREKFKDCEIEQSEGYMLYYYDFDFAEPYLRRGVMRIRNKKSNS